MARTSIEHPASASDLKKARIFLPILSGLGMREFACRSPSPSYTNTQRSSESQNLDNAVVASLFWDSLVSFSGFISLPHLPNEPAFRIGTAGRAPRQPLPLPATARQPLQGGGGDATGLGVGNLR